MMRLDHFLNRPEHLPARSVRELVLDWLVFAAVLAAFYALLHYGPAQ
jgi:hypothetical protein